MSFTTSLAIGLGLGLVNGAIWFFGQRWWLQKRGLLIFCKLAILALVIWVLLSKGGLDPIGFLVGFSAMLIFLVGRLVKWS